MNERYNVVKDQMCDIAIQLLRNPLKYLHEFELTGSEHNDNDSLSADNVIEALIGHDSLRRLTISDDIMIDAWMRPPRFDDRHPPKRLRQGCKALATLLKKPSCKLKALTLNGNNINNQGARTLAASSAEIPLSKN
jgi:hypothetical protein